MMKASVLAMHSDSRLKHGPNQGFAWQLPLLPFAGIMQSDTASKWLLRVCWLIFPLEIIIGKGLSEKLVVNFGGSATLVAGKLAALLVMSVVVACAMRLLSRFPKNAGYAQPPTELPAVSQVFLSFLASLLIVDVVWNLSMFVYWAGVKLSLFNHVIYQADLYNLALRGVSKSLETFRFYEPYSDVNFEIWDMFGPALFHTVLALLVIACVDKKWWSASGVRRQWYGIMSWAILAVLLSVAIAVLDVAAYRQFFTVS